MTYKCGIGLGMATIGFTPRDPHVVCDICGTIDNGVRVDGYPKQWLHNGTAPKGWKMVRREMEDGIYRRDYCGRCKDKGDG